jgi:alpha-methylacyl-CoA racemase
VFAGTDACVYPVLELAETPADPHVAARGSVRPDDAMGPQVTPAPRLSETPGTAGPLRPVARAAQQELLGALGIDAEDVRRYQESGALHLPSA